MAENLEKINNKSHHVETKDGNLILDSHKVSYHYDRIEAWENGEKIAPVSVDMALTRACGAMCSFCYAMVQEPQDRQNIKTKEALELLDDFAKIGILESLKWPFSEKIFNFRKKNHDFFVHISLLPGGRMEWSGAQSGAQFIHTEHVCLMCTHTSGVLVVSKNQTYRQISFKRAP